MKNELKCTCKYCGETNKTKSVSKLAITPQLGTKTYVRCKKCHKVSVIDRQGLSGTSWVDPLKNSDKQ